MNKIKELRKAKKMTQNQLCEILKIAQPTLSGYENETSEPDFATFQKIADFFNVSVDYLLGRDEIKNPPNVYDVDGIISFEEIGTICAGFNGVINETPTGELIELPASMIRGGDKEDYFVLRVSGNSMYPRILEGDRILCKRCSSVDSGSFAVVLYDGECATVKKVNYVHGEDWLELIPINPDYAPKRIEGADLQQCRILGKVIKLIRDL